MRAGWRALALAGLLLATSAGTAHADELDLDVEIPAVTDQPFEVFDAQLRWGLNEETGSGAFAGGCNFLSAGKVGNTGGSKFWTEQDDYFRASAGAVSVVKPVATSRGVTHRPVSFADRCKDAHGRAVSASSTSGTGVQLVMDEGTGHVDPATGDARISWQGSVTVVFYGGLTYWWFSDPVLEVSGGRGTLTATAGGYGSTREDMDKWEALEPTRITLAKLPDVSLRGEKGFSVRPAYREVKVDVPANAPSQVRSGPDWGSFPQSFVDFQELTGQQSFWYSSGGARDAAKPATPLTVSYDAQDPQDPDDGGKDEDESAEDDDAPPANAVTPPPVRPAPPGVQGPPVANDPAALRELPTAVPSVTVLPVSATLAAPGPGVLASTGSEPSWLAIAGAAILLGAALAVLGYVRGWLVWPTSNRKEAR